MSITEPEWLVPIHGEYRHMVANAKLGYLMGIPKDHVLVCEDGDVLELSDDGLKAIGRVPAGYLYVDGIVGDVGQGVLRDRRVLAEEGVVVVVVTVDLQTRKVLTGPEIITRGWVYAPEAEDLLDEACDRVAAVLEASLAAGVKDVESLERDVRKAAGKQTTSAWLADAAERKLRSEGLVAVVRAWEREHGEITDDERLAAARELTRPRRR